MNWPNHNHHHKHKQRKYVKNIRIYKNYLKLSKSRFTQLRVVLAKNFIKFKNHKKGPLKYGFSSFSRKTNNCADLPSF